MYVTLSLYQAAMDLGPSPDVLPNVVPMMAGVERAFDSYRMCAVPSRDAVTEDVSFEVSGSSHHCDCVGVCLCVCCKDKGVWRSASPASYLLGLCTSWVGY